jgi:hypothetical protein
MMMRARTLILGALTIGGLAALACSAGDFDAQSKVTSVRMFGVRADKPFANPGDTVTLTSLVVDGRRDKPRPLKVFWIPVVCTNPREDLYYACFIPGSVTDGGARLAAPFPTDAAAPPATAGSGSVLDRIPKDVDLGNFLPQGDTFSFQLPADIIQPRAGSAPYGLAIVFNIACAGQVRYVGRSGINPQQVPIQCTDEQGKQLTPDDYVIGINRVYSYGDRTNTNPVVEKVTLDGADVDLQAGITVDHCVASRRSDCKEWKIDVRVSDASWEINPEPGEAVNQHEQIWATYYSDQGDLEDDARLLFDSTKGRVSESAVKYRAPYAPGDGTLWIVVHDNRVGAAFVVLPFHVK